MRRFYSLDIQPDLFDGVLLMKAWGSIGARGRMLAERYNKALAAAAVQRQAERKRRGYAGEPAREIVWCP